LNIDVIATSRDGRDGTVACDINDADTIKKLAQGCSAVIACVGVIGTEQDKEVNAGTATAAKAAKAAGVERFVYITVAPEVKEFAKDIKFLKGYMEGKSISRETVLELFGDKATLIEPTFIYGGGSFELNPPRVASFYGKFIEGLLSSSPARSVERVLSPGIIKIALKPPVPVEAVANAAIAGALGKTAPILDSHDAIKAAAATLEA
jgi:nucleoside-diphosphate-sugar epimerase